MTIEANRKYMRVNSPILTGKQIRKSRPDLYVRDDTSKKIVLFEVAYAWEKHLKLKLVYQMMSVQY